MKMHLSYCIEEECSTSNRNNCQRHRCCYFRLPWKYVMEEDNVWCSLHRSDKMVVFHTQKWCMCLFCSTFDPEQSVNYKTKRLWQCQTNFFVKKNEKNFRTLVSVEWDRVCCCRVFLPKWQKWLRICNQSHNQWAGDCWLCLVHTAVRRVHLINMNCPNRKSTTKKKKDEEQWLT
jgi:hypothetical protein